MRRWDLGFSPSVVRMPFAKPYVRAGKWRLMMLFDQSLQEMEEAATALAEQRVAGLAGGAVLGGIREEAAALKEEYSRMGAKLRELEQKMLQKVCFASKERHVLHE